MCHQPPHVVSLLHHVKRPPAPRSRGHESSLLQPSAHPLSSCGASTLQHHTERHRACHQPINAASACDARPLAPAAASRPPPRSRAPQWHAWTWRPHIVTHLRLRCHPWTRTGVDAWCCCAPVAHPLSQNPSAAARAPAALASMAGIVARSSRRFAATLLQQTRGMASFGSARPGEPTPAITPCEGPTGVLEVRQLAQQRRAWEARTGGGRRRPALCSRLQAPLAPCLGPVQ